MCCTNLLEYCITFELERFKENATNKLGLVTFTSFHAPDITGHWAPDAAKPVFNLARIGWWWKPLEIALYPPASHKKSQYINWEIVVFHQVITWPYCYCILNHSVCYYTKENINESFYLALIITDWTQGTSLFVRPGLKRVSLLNSSWCSTVSGLVNCIVQPNRVFIVE